MTNHPNHGQYPEPAPVFDGVDHPIEIIGEARTAEEAIKIYREYLLGTGARAVNALKACPELRGTGPVDGWVPVLADE